LVAVDYQERLVRWLCGDRSAIECEVWEVPLLEWRAAVHCLVQGFYAQTSRSSWREAKVKSVWSTVARMTEYTLRGFPMQDVTWEGEEGKAGQSVPIHDPLPF
jgi:hypothetical protein